MDYVLTTTADNDAFVRTAVEKLEQAIVQAIESKGGCSLGLSGGSTPRETYVKLGESTLIDWDKVQLFLVDDRYVPADHEDSNQKLVRETLLQHAEIPEDNMLFPDTSRPLADCISMYVHGLIGLFQEFPPDILVLGIGEDGHIASLFPPVPEHVFSEQLALHTQTDTFAVRDRITISPLVIMAAQYDVLLLKGDKKKHVFDECASAEEADPVRWPLHIPMATGKLDVVYQS